MTLRPHRKPASHPRDIIKSLAAICLTLFFFVFTEWVSAAYEDSSSERAILTEAVTIPIHVQGKQVGATTVPAGTKVTVVGREDGAKVSVKHGALEPVWVEESQVSGLAAKQPHASKPARSSASITPEQLSSLVAAEKWEELASACETLAQQDSEKFSGFSDLGNQLRSALQAKAAAVAQQTKAEAEAKRLRRNADVVGQPNRLNPSDRSPMERARKLREQAEAVIEEAQTALDTSEVQIALTATNILSSLLGLKRLAEPETASSPSSLADNEASEAKVLARPSPSGISATTAATKPDTLTPTVVEPIRTNAAPINIVTTLKELANKYSLQRAFYTNSHFRSRPVETYADIVDGLASHMSCTDTNQLKHYITADDVTEGSDIRIAYVQTLITKHNFTIKYKTTTSRTAPVSVDRWSGNIKFSSVDREDINTYDIKAIDIPFLLHCRIKRDEWSEIALSNNVLEGVLKEVGRSDSGELQATFKTIRSLDGKKGGRMYIDRNDSHESNGLGGSDWSRISDKLLDLIPEIKYNLDYALESYERKEKAKAQKQQAEAQATKQREAAKELFK
jgi:hypothetical protein